MKRRITTFAGLAAALAAGLLVALTLAASAFAWSPDSLPPGFTVDHIRAVGAATCEDSYRIHSSMPGVFSDPFCTDSPTYQQDFDAWVNAHYTPPATTTAASTTATTSTVPASTDPVTTTDAAPAPAPAPSVTTDAQVTTDAIAGLQAQIDALRAELQQLVCLLQTSQTLDPGILAGLLSLGSCG